ncbi:MAG: hypothetical protein ACXWDM_01675 [Nocardioides sp.]
MVKTFVALSTATLLVIVIFVSFADLGRPGLGAGAENLQSMTSATAGADRFGVKRIYPTRSGGMTWVSKWGERRRITGVDPLDPWFDADHGQATFLAARGRLRITGDIPRIFIYHPRRSRQWRDVEITMYFKRVRDDGVPYAGMVSVARSNHGVTGRETRDLCDSRGLGARMRYDGGIDFDKETRHPFAAQTAGKVYWPRGMPTNVWIGYKHVVYDLPDGRVRQELWIDESGGAGGGSWVMLNAITDDGHLFGDRACAAGIDPEMRLTNDPGRPGSESAKPNIAVYFRSDGVGRKGLVYKWGSVREIRVD